MTQPVALITGAGGGIGKAVAVLLAQRGYAIAALDCQAEGMRILVGQLGEKHPCMCVGADVTRPDTVVTAVQDVERGLGPVELLVASAGVGIETTTEDLRPDDVKKVIDVNLTGVANSIAAVLPGMRERRRGHLVALSSVASFRGLPRMLAYCASKAGLNAFMEGLRVEVRPLGIHTTIVCPAWIRTPMTADLHDKLPMLEPEVAAAQVVRAIEKKWAYHTFPASFRWQRRVMYWMPWSWQDALLRRMSRGLAMKPRPPDGSPPPASGPSTSPPDPAH